MDLEFGNYRLKRAERLLLGPNGPVELSARSFDILAMLIERPDEVIGKTELFDAVWPGLVVEENTLQVHISALRKLLSAEMIATVHGRGYKYAGPKPFVATAEFTAPSRPSIAILPFDNMSGAKTPIANSTSTRVPSVPSGYSCLTIQDRGKPSHTIDVFLSHEGGAARIVGLDRNW